MHHKNLDIIVALIITGLSVIWTLLHATIPVIGIILALPLVLVIPGYTLTEALFRKRSLNAFEHLVFSLGLSLAIDILSGLFLNVLPIGLQATSWVMLLGLLILVFSLLAVYFRRGVSMSGESRGRPLKFRLNIYQGILFGLAILITILSFVYSGIGVIGQPHPGFTQLWMLPEVQIGKSCAVRLGVRSFEATSVMYHLTITMNGDQVAIPSSVLLAPQEEWDRLVPIASRATDEIYVEVRLYRLDKPETVYREVHLTFHNLKESKNEEVRLCGMPSVSTPSSLSLVSTYRGNIYDIPTNLTTSISLTGIQQSGRSITGYFTTGTGLLRSRSFKGMFITAQDIQFTITDDTGHVILLFEGGLQSDGIIYGNYCGLDQKGYCNSNSNYGYGLWSVAPMPYATRRSVYT